MNNRFNFLNKEDKVLLIEPICFANDHCTCNTALILILSTLSRDLTFISHYTHSKIVKKILNKLKVKISLKLIEIKFLKNYLFNWGLIYFVGLAYTSILVMKRKYSRIVFFATDYSLFPLFLVFLRFIDKSDSKYFLVIHKHLRIVNKKNFFLKFWKILFKDPNINFIFLDKNSINSINTIKKYVSNSDRINVCNFKEVYFEINSERKNSLNKILCKANDFQDLLRTKNIIGYKYSLIIKNEYYYLKNNLGEELEFFILNESNKVDALDYLNILNQCKYVLVNKSRENDNFSSGLRLDALWTNKQIIEI